MLNIIKAIKEKSTLIIKGEKHLLLNQTDLYDILSIYRDQIEVFTLAKYEVKGYSYLDKETLYQKELEFKKSLFN